MRTIAKIENICYIIFGMSSYDGGYTMNTQHLQYLIEIERTRSVSQAAENLFIGQPNLSRILHEMEANARFHAFLREPASGVRSTDARRNFSAARQEHHPGTRTPLTRSDRKPPGGKPAAHLHSARGVHSRSDGGLSQYGLPQSSQNLDAVVRECHARQAIEMLENGEVEVGVIRFRSGIPRLF